MKNFTNEKRCFEIIQYNRTGIKDIDTSSKTHTGQEFKINKNVGSIIRLFLAIMVFVVFVLTIAK